MMMASPVWGAVADRYGRKLMVQLGELGRWGDFAPHLSTP